MAGTEAALVVADAGPLIHLDELASLDVLTGYAEILVPVQFGLRYGSIVRRHCKVPSSSLSGSRRHPALPHGCANQF